MGKWSRWPRWEQWENLRGVIDRQGIGPDETSQLSGVKYGATGANGGYSSASSAVSQETWVYDAAGNRQTAVASSGTTSYTANDVNQYTAIGGSTPVYTSRGDLGALGDLAYTYDAYGNLIRAHNTSTNVLAKYWRDASGHRAVKDVDGEKTIYFNLSMNRLEAYDVMAETASSTIYEPGIDRPLAEVSDGGAVRFYHQDWLGNVAMVTDTAGAVVQKYSYDAWGNVSAVDGSGASVSGSAYVTNLLYTGREFDLETGLYHYRARAYGSVIGRFIQNDPIDFSGGDSNLYRYVANNPVNYTDELGLFWGAPGAAAGGILGGIGGFFGEVGYELMDLANGGCFDWKTVGSATAGAAVGGALVGALTSADPITAGAIGAAALGGLASGVTAGAIDNNFGIGPSPHAP